MSMKFYTFEQWIASHPELRKKIDDCDVCIEGHMDCKLCDGDKLLQPCAVCGNLGEVDCPVCMAELKEEYNAQLADDRIRLQRAMKAVA